MNTQQRQNMVYALTMHELNWFLENRACAQQVATFYANGGFNAYTDEKLEEAYRLKFESDEPMQEGIKFARKCDITGEGMDKGWCIGDGEMYIKYERDALAEAVRHGYTDLSEAFDDGLMYWTEWEVPFDYQYEVIDGVLTEIE